MDSKRFLGVLLAFVVLFSLGATPVFAANPSPGSHTGQGRFVQTGVVVNAANQIAKYRVAANNAEVVFSVGKMDFEKSRLDWLGAKSAWLDGNHDSNRLFGKARNYLLKSTSQLENYLTLAGAKLANANKLSGFDSNALIAQVDVENADLNSLKASIGGATSIAGLKALLPQVQSDWNAAKAVAKEVSGAVLLGNTNRLVTGLNGLGNSINTRIAALDANGVDTSAAKSAMADFNAKLADANSRLVLALGFFNQITVGSDASQLFEEGKSALNAAFGDLRAASQDLKSAARALVQTRGGSGSGGDLNRSYHNAGGQNSNGQNTGNNDGNSGGSD